MKKRLIFIILTLCFVHLVFAQEQSVKAEASLDSILLGNYLKLTITANNFPDAKIEAPDFVGFQIVSGPNYASSMTMINGDVSQRISYTYMLEPKDVGQYYIGSAQVKSGDKILETLPVEINVYHNPDGIVQRPQKEAVRDNWFSWPGRGEAKPRKKPKKKRKVYRL